MENKKTGALKTGPQIEDIQAAARSVADGLGFICDTCGELGSVKQDPMLTQLAGVLEALKVQADKVREYVSTIE